MKRKLILVLTFFAIFLVSRAQFSLTSTNALCFAACNGAVHITPDSGYFYKWSTGDTSGIGAKSGLCAGDYHCTVVNSVGTILDTLNFFIYQPDSLALEYMVDSVSCSGARDGRVFIVATGGVPPYNYLLRTYLTLDTGYVADSTGYYSHLPADLYLVFVRDSNSCVAGDSVSVRPSSRPCTGIQDIKQLLSFSLLPNPATDVLNITYELNEPTPLHLSIYDMSGRKVMEVLNETQKAGEHKHSINVKELAAGCYVLNVTSVEGSFNERFVKVVRFHSP